MTYAWFKIVNKAEFEATGLISRSLELILEGIGPKTVLITRANTLAITVDDLFLPVGVTAENPFVIGERAVFLDGNDDVWYGVQIED